MIKKNRQIKEAKVAEIKEKLEKAQGIALANYQGLTVEGAGGGQNDEHHGGENADICKADGVLLHAVQHA